MRASSDTVVKAGARAETGDAEAARAYLESARTIVDARLDALVPAASVEPVAVHAAMRWSLFAGGKRLRPALVLATGEAFGALPDSLINTACAFELVHTYSLVHDDLPSMDDDDLRRGRPTCHVKFGEATAILAGDAMQALAFQIIAEDDALDAHARVRLVAELARAAGTPGGMVAGQSHDLSAESRRDVTAAELDLIHRHKTGALIVAAARAGALIAGAGERQLRSVGDYAAALGLLFQITDDLLDVTATAEALGKTPGKDARAQKATYPALHGLDAARQRGRAVYEQALAALSEGEQNAPLLRSIARLILERHA
ncbi:MAG TPA: farnesyl diphosphate synthase [Pyrinomonadaceae bacterium]|jgi:geranylgeranyl pyrophosphate synthase